MLRITDIDHKPIRFPPVYGYINHPLLSLHEALNPIVSQIEYLEQFIKIAISSCHFPSEHGLTRDESAAIFIYTMDWGDDSLYRVLNKALRNNDRSILIPWHGYLKLFDTALKKLPSLQIVLWRGINLDISKNFKAGEVLTWWSFSSCSSVLKVVKQFLGSVSTLIMIEAKNGKSISTYSNFTNEDEVVLGLGTELRVVSDVLDLPTLNVVHLLEISDENDKSHSSSLAITNAVSSLKIENKTSIDKEPLTFKIETFKDGSKYEGEWKNKKKHGHGIKYYNDGKKYTGGWVNDNEEGQGHLTFPNGDRYEGEFRNGVKHGKGTYYFDSGNIYTGDWVDDQQSGEGTLTWPSGNRFQGQFKNGKRNGKGTKYFANRNIQRGVWWNDEFVQ